jgi:acyl-homoserine lactone acylase PvdQ
MIVVGEQSVFDGHDHSLEPNAPRARAQRRAFAVSAALAFCVTWGTIACRRAEPPPRPLLADVAGTRAIAGVSAPVRVARDRWGVPHIYAQNQDDLFFAQGFVQAQDRLFQMDLWRRSSLGRLAEVLGPNFAERDAMTRRIQYVGDPDAEWSGYAADTRAIATAFVRGINAWVALARSRPPEAFVLAGWKPDFWAPVDLLNRTDAFVAGRDAIDDLFRLRLIATLGARRAAAILPREAVADLPRGLDPDIASPVVGDAIRSVGAPPFFLGLARPIADARTTDATGDAFPHEDIPLDVRPLPLPSPRYLVGLHAPGWNVVGATAPWLPGVAIGHNDRMAWDMDPVDVDTQDVYVERVNPSNPHQVEAMGRFVDTTLVEDPLVIRGRAQPLVFDRERTRHGAIVAVDRERHLAFTVRWTGAEPGAAGDLIALELDRATTMDAFHSALARWKTPARRVTFADIDGHRGSEIAALAPVRRGWTGRLPAPGWTGANEWIGWRRPATADAASPIALLARLHPDRADALVRDLQAAASARDAATAQRALIVNAVADALKGAVPGGAAIFTHPLAISGAARRRFNIGPVRPAAADAHAFAVTFDTADWDRSTAMNAPGQSESPASAHYGDLVPPWRDGKPIALVFSDRAVGASTEATLTLVPERPVRQP